MNRLLSRAARSSRRWPYLLAMLAVSQLAGCAHVVSSRGFVQATAQTGSRAERLLSGGTASTDLHFVYGYAPLGRENCAQSTQPSPGDHYGVVVCDGNTPLSAASFREQADSQGELPDAQARERLARIAANTLVPAAVVFHPQ